MGTLCTPHPGGSFPPLLLFFPIGFLAAGGGFDAPTCFRARPRTVYLWGRMVELDGPVCEVSTGHGCELNKLDCYLSGIGSFWLGMFPCSHRSLSPLCNVLIVGGIETASVHSPTWWFPFGRLHFSLRVFGCTQRGFLTCPLLSTERIHLCGRVLVIDAASVVVSIPHQSPRQVVGVVS